MGSLFLRLGMIVKFGDFTKLKIGFIFQNDSVFDRRKSGSKSRSEFCKDAWASEPYDFDT